MGSPINGNPTNAPIRMAGVRRPQRLALWSLNMPANRLTDNGQQGSKETNQPGYQVLFLH